LKAFADSDVPNLIANRKTLHEQRFIWIYKIQGVKKLECMKQLTLQDMFKKIKEVFFLLRDPKSEKPLKLFR
jgi:hypothetical protein